MTPRARTRRRAASRPARPRRRRAPEEKRSRILVAARALFAARGYAATGTADVARRAGVSEGIVFHHFGSKRGLLSAVAAAYGRELADVMFQGREIELPPDGARGMLRRAFAYVREHGFMTSALGAVSDPDERADADEAARREIVEALTRAYARWSERGLVRPMDPRIVAELTAALVAAGLHECFVRGDGSREDAILEEVVRCIEGAVSPIAGAAAGASVPASAAEAPPPAGPERRAP